MSKSLARISGRLRRTVTVRRILAALAVLLVVMIAMQVAPFGTRGMDRLVSGKGTLDMRFGYSAETVTRLFGALGATGRSAYLRFLALDLVYMICSAWFQSLTMSRLTSKAGLTERLCMVNLLPWSKCAFDLAENLAILDLLLLFPSRVPFLAAVASCLTVGKWILYYSCVAILFGLGALTSSKGMSTKLNLGMKGADR